MVLSDILDNVINLARQKKKSELKVFFEGLSAAEIYWIETVMYLGRDSGRAAGIFDKYTDLSSFSVHDAIRTILEKAPMPDYIENGINKLRDDGIDIDTLLTTHIDSPLASLNSGDEIVLVCNQWICDTCGKIINQAKDGMLIWFRRNEENSISICRDIQIVHHMSRSPLGGCNGCYPDQEMELRRDGSSICDTHLDQLTGLDGLVRLLAFIENNEFSSHDISRIIMRIFVPGYEQARPYFDMAIQTGIVEQGWAQDFFSQSDLGRIVANISKLQNCPQHT